MNSFLSGIIGDGLGAAVRHAATTSGGALVAHGYMTGQDYQSWIGSLCFLGGLAWSIFQKVQARKTAGLPLWNAPAPAQAIGPKK